MPGSLFLFFFFFITFFWSAKPDGRTEVAQIETYEELKVQAARKFPLFMHVYYVARSKSWK